MSSPSSVDQTPQAQPRAGLTFVEKLGYGLGDTASHFVWDMVGFWLLFFYTDVYKIPAAAAGTIMLIARFWDMGIDPVIGIISDRTRTRWGKFRPYILFGALPYAVLAVLTFTTPDLGETGKIIYAGATYVLLMTAYAAINLPYSSLAAVMTSDTYERAGINQYRFICAFAGQLVVTGLALYLAKLFGGGDKARGFQYTLVLFAILSLIFFFITFKTSKERVQPLKTSEGSVKRDLDSRPWIILTIVGIVSFVMFVVQSAAIDYYYYCIGKEGSFLLFNVISLIALVIALPFSKPLAKRFGDQNVFIASFLISSAFFVALYVRGEKNLVTIYVLNILAKIAYAPAVPLLWMLLPGSLREDIKNLFKNRPWIILAIVGIVSFVMFAMQNAAIAYYFKYYIGKEDSVQLFNVIGTIALIVALPFSKPLAKRFGNKNVFIGSSLISGAFFISLYLPGEKDIITIYILNILAKMAYAPAVPLLWTMIADSADYSEWKSGRRATGLYFSAATFAQKAGWGIGAAIAGWVLYIFNYVPDVMQTPKALTGIKLLISVIPGILYASCALFMIFYNIDSKTADQMKTDLDSRREKEKAG